MAVDLFDAIALLSRLEHILPVVPPLCDMMGKLGDDDASDMGHMPRVSKMIKWVKNR